MVQDGETGLLVDPSDSNELRDAVRKLLNDKDLRERLAEAARARRGLFTREGTFAEVEAVLRGAARGEKLTSTEESSPESA